MSAPFSLDESDCRILTALQQDASRTNRSLAREVGLSPAPCLRRTQRLEQSGVVRGYVALVDRVKVGLSVQALAFVTLENHRAGPARQFEAVVQRRPEVLECLRVSGAFDYLLRVIVPSMAAYSAFLDQHLLSLAAVRSVNSSFELGVLKQTTALPLSRPAGRTIPQASRRRANF